MTTAYVRAADLLDGGTTSPDTRRTQFTDDHPLALDVEQRFDHTAVRTPALEHIAEQLRATVDTRAGRLVVSIPPQEGKALDTATPILTTAGWSTMGELRVGDEVFHPDGHPVRVVEAHPVRHDRPCYRITTTDGRILVADGEHLWTVRDRTRRGGGRGGNALAPWETLTTDQLLARGLRAHGGYRFRLPDQHAVVSKPVDLPIDPYLLGAWLGDGLSRGAALVVGDQDLDATLDQLAPVGARIVSTTRERTAWRVGFATGPMRDGFQARAMRLGVWGAKHIPDLYLTAGTEQRLALLQGLLDTDGTIFRTQTSSRVEFTSTRQVLADGVLYLARSLGWRATVRDSAALLNGREVGRRWRVTFTPQVGDPPPFRLPRKAARVQAAQSRGGERTAVSIAAIEPVASRPVRCIRVACPDGLFLAGRDLVATHNTELLRALCFWLLACNPATRIVYASYALSRARKSGRAVRDHIRTHGADLGLRLNRGSWDAADWTLDGHRGGMLCVGVGGALTGAPADVLIVDDPIRGQREADSDTIRSALHEWWSTVARTRLSSGAVVIVVQTRWHPDDLAGRRIAEGWPAVNIPAIADGHAPDALDRPVGEWLLSAQGRTDADWADTRAEVGERAFAALYQGEPAPAEGGIFQRVWFTRHRLSIIPDGCLPPTVYVDPADNAGDGDEAGIIVATRHPATQRALLLADLSAPMTVARWARLALLTCVRWQAPTLAWEKSLSQLAQRITEAWTLLHLQATAIRASNGDRDRALTRLTRPDDTVDAVQVLAQQLAELDDDDVAGVLRFGSTGPARRPITAKGSKDLRMQLAAPLFETGRAAIVGALPVLEHQAATWQVGQSSPDRVDTAVHAVLDLAGTGGPTTVRRPGRAATRVPTRTPARSLPSTAGRVGR